MEALEQLIEFFRPRLRRNMNGRLNSALRAEMGESDVVQETCLNAVVKFPLFSGTTEGELWVWLRKILKNKVISLIRRKHVVMTSLEGYSSGGTPGQEPVDSAPSPSSVVGAEEERPSDEKTKKELLDAVDRLDPDHRQAIILRNFYNFSVKQIGHVMNRSAGAAKQVHRRALEELRSKLGVDHERQ